LKFGESELNNGTKIINILVGDADSDNNEIEFKIGKKGLADIIVKSKYLS